MTPAVGVPVVFDPEAWRLRIRAAAKRRWPHWWRRVGFRPEDVYAARQLHRAAARAYRARRMSADIHRLEINAGYLFEACCTNNFWEARWHVDRIVRIFQEIQEAEALERELEDPDGPIGVTLPQGGPSP